MKNHSRRFAFILILLAACLWGTMGLFVRYLNAHGLSSMEIVEARCLIAFLLLFPSVALYGRIAHRDSLLKIRLKNVLPLLGTGIASMVFFNFCYFSAISKMNLSAAAILLYTAPIFVTLLSVPLFREKITRRKVAALVLAFAGCALVSNVVSASEQLSLSGLLLGLGSGLGYALYSIFSRYALNQGMNSVSISVFTFLFASLGGAVFTDFHAIADTLRHYGLPLLLFLILYCIVTTIAPYLLYTAGLVYIENGPASVIASAEPVVATLLGLFLFHETLTFPNILGILMVIGAIILLSLKQ